VPPAGHYGDAVSWSTAGGDREGGEGARPAEDILSPATLARLRASAGGLGGPPLFTTTALPAELASLGRIGLRPLGAVRGSSMHHVGFPGPATAASTEIPALTRALYTARRFAVARLRASAAVLGAVGVVGMRLEHRAHAFGPEMVEVIAAGDAVAHAERPGWDGRPAPPVMEPSPPDYEPWTTTLDADGLSVAVSVGLLPVAAVFGTCVHHLDRRPVPETQWPGQEVPSWTRAVADAREVALARLQADAQRYGADGVIALRDREIDHDWDGEAIEYLVTGSAVRRHPTPGGAQGR
jgi:uncharacterized protein YbjQ (UPF0145 family)